MPTSVHAVALVPKPTALSGGKMERFENPARGQTFNRCRNRRIVERRGALVPRQHQPLGGHGRWQCGADDETEIARIIRCDRRGRTCFVEQPQHLGVRAPLFRQRLIKRRQARQCIGIREDTSLAHGRQVCASALICVR
jgi:hypothetical protein